MRWVTVVLDDGRIDKVISRLTEAKNVRVHYLANHRRRGRGID
jgi:hypothetical protein